MPDLYTKYERNDDGDLINPPTIPDYERRLVEAAANGDDDQIEMLTEEYHEKRGELADRHDARVDKRAEGDRTLLAERDERTRAENAEKSAAAAEQRRRAEADKLREDNENRSTPQPADNPVTDTTGGEVSFSPGPATVENPAGQFTRPGGENR